MPNWVKNIIHIEGPAEDITKALELMRDNNVDGGIDFNNIIPMPERLGIVAGGYDTYYVALYLRTLSASEIKRLMDEFHSRLVSFYGTYLKKYGDSFSIAKGFMDIPEGKLKRMKENIDRDYKNISPTSIEDVGKAYVDNILEYGADTWYDWCIDNWGTKWNARECEIGDNFLEFETAWDAPFPIVEELSRRFPELTFGHEYADENLGCNCGAHVYKRGIETSTYGFESADEAHDFASMLWGYGPDDDDIVKETK